MSKFKMPSKFNKQMNNNKNYNRYYMSVAQARQIIKDVPYDDSIIEMWLSDDRNITQWIDAAKKMTETCNKDEQRGISLEDVVNAYEAEYRRIAKVQGVTFNWYMPIFFLAKEEIKNQFIANQFLNSMQVIKLG